MSTAEILRQPSPDDLRQAIGNNAAGFYQAIGQSPHIHLEQPPNLLRVMSDVPFPIGNAIFQARFDGDAAAIQAQVQQALNPFRAHGLPVVWIVDSTSQPSDLGEYLAAEGLYRAPDIPGMAADIDTLHPVQPVDEAVTVERVTDATTLQEWSRVFNAAFDVPSVPGQFWYEALLSLGLTGDVPLRHYVARREGYVVGTASLLLWGGVAGIYNVATLSNWRRRGIGTALTLRPLQVAQAEAGYQVAVLQTSMAAMSLYEGLGFETYCHFEAYAMPGGA